MLLDLLIVEEMLIESIKVGISILNNSFSANGWKTNITLKNKQFNYFDLLKNYMSGKLH